MPNNEKKSFAFFKKTKETSEIKNFKKIIEKDPDNDRAYVRLAELYARAGDEDAAMELYEKAAVLFEKKGFINKSKAVLKQALAINPEHGKINVLLADLDKESGLYQDAIARYQVAANYYANEGNRIAAINILKKIIEIYPDDLNYSIKLAKLFVSEQNYKEAIKILNPLSVNLKIEGKLSEYVVVLNLLYIATHESEEVGRDLVNAYIKTGAYKKALSILQKLVISNPNSIEYYEKLSYLFERLGEKKKLLSTLKQVAIFYKENKQIEESNKIYRKILTIEPTDREALIALHEESKLRDLISERIENTSSDIKMVADLEGGQFEQESDDDIDIEIDISDDESVDKVQQVEKEKISTKTTDFSSLIKEAKVFISYSLFSKAKDRLKSVEQWHSVPEILELMIEIYIEENKNEKAVDLMFKLLDVYFDLKDKEKAEALLNDIKEFVPEDGRILSFEMKLKTLLDSAEPNDGLEELADEEKQDDSNNANTGLELDLDFEIEPEKELDSPKEQENDLEPDDVDIEPPQDKLDELAFFIEIQDFKSASLLFQDLIVQYPNSKLLSDFNETMPSGGQDFAETMSDVKRTISDTMNSGDKNAEDFYDMAIVHSSMGMQTEALDYMKKACELEPENRKFLTAYAQLAEDFERYKDAIISLESLLRLIDNDSEKKEILEKLSKLYYHLGDEKKRLKIDAEINLLKI